ncbi:type IV secretion system protein VirB10 [Altererythrobacter atlanticus]|uniref:Type IV secretion system protein virB10 n=1 Tax=Croceibacterium atlanticum TaxID=1267766 RepID=A0A0F7KW44_9SPHN|nr:TrbI/VirB10 family protein [Croceibacterium atlanticum]AKH43934.1 Type IV secretion system protein virB10 [Croceibacterium atlanticum]MBB5733616.1 type IV secretion system protein VirB10 [Croceibacterium atlanticum]
MKLAMRLPEKNHGAPRDSDPREEAGAEVIDLASRTAYPAVANGKGRSDALGLAAGVASVAILGAATLWGLNASRMGSEETAQPAVQPVPKAPAATPAPAQQEGRPLANAAPNRPAAAPEPVIANQPEVAPAGNPYASPAMVFDQSLAPAPLAEGVAPPAGDAAGGPASGSSAYDFASRIGGVGGAPAVARNDIDPQNTVTQGTMIPAILETAINTDVPGFARAVVSTDVRSFDGTRILVPRGSRLVGQYQSGLQSGQKRAYVIWQRLTRPDGVSVALASPATGFDGTGGLPGDVNSHFFKRFGSAILLSVISGLTTIASGGTSVVLGGGQSAASTALQQDGQIAPTVRVRQGEPIRVFTARDLDFSQAPRL